MYADGVHILHRADRDNVALGVAHYLELDLLPARYALLDKHLSDGREVQTVARYLAELLLGVYDTAACAAQRECGTNYKRIADALLIGEGNSVLNGVYDEGGYAGLTDGLHRVLEHLSVLCLVDGLGFCA